MSARVNAPTLIGRYEIHREIAAGGTATLHVGRLRGAGGFTRTVAIKRLHPAYARDPEFGAMFLDEARLSARIRHPNVVPVLDVTAHEGELLLVMELVDGESLARLVRAGRVPLPIVAAIMLDALRGLHAAHEATDERGVPLELVHRDVSPHNLLVGIDGVTRVVDFGIAKAVSRAQVTREGTVKGKFAYMAPEQLAGVVGAPSGLVVVDRRTDVYAAGIVLWELVTGERLFVADDEGALLAKVAAPRITPPALLVPEAAPVDAVVMRALARDQDLRFDTAAAMADALEAALTPARREDVARWVEANASAALEDRRRAVRAAEGHEAEQMAPAARVHDAGAHTAIAQTGPVRAAPRWPFAVFGALSLVAVGVSSWLRAPSVVAAPAPSVQAPPAIEETGPAVGGSPIDASAPAPSSSISAVISVAPRPPVPPPPNVPKTAAPKKPSCDPPFVIDAEGKKIFRAECL